MRRVLVLLFFAVIVSLSFGMPQKVSEKCAKQKIMSDSCMRVQYGNAIFERWFVFDTLSYVWGNHNYLCKWNDWFQGDTISSYELNYVFHFPGSQISPYDEYGVEFTVNGTVKGDVACCDFVRQNPTLITQGQMEKLTLKHLNKPLKDCYTVLWLFDWYSDKNDNLTDLDSTHAYIEVHDYTRKGGTKNETTFKAWDYTILVDAYTGKFIGKDEHIYEGINGHF